MSNPENYDHLPTIIFVPGALHPPLPFYSKVIAQLQEVGYDCVAVSTVTVNTAKRPLMNFDPDVAVIRSAIEGVAAKAKDSIVFMHSYAGLPGSEACKGLVKGVDGREFGVIHLIYCSAAVMPEGISLVDTVMAEMPDNLYKISDDGLLMLPLEPERVVYNECTPEDAKYLGKHLRPHSFKAFGSTLTYAAWKHVPSTFIYCMKDNLASYETQVRMVEASGGNFSTVKIEADHTPFWSRPNETVAAIRKAAGEKI